MAARARWTAGAAAVSTALAAGLLLLAVLPASSLAGLAAAVSGRPPAGTRQVASTQPAAVRWESSRPWTGSTPYRPAASSRLAPSPTPSPGGGRPSAGGSAAGARPQASARAASGGSAAAGVRPVATTARFGPTPPTLPTPPNGPVGPGPLEPPNRPWWVGGPGVPPCPVVQQRSSQAFWNCQLQPRYDCPQFTGPAAQVLLLATPGVRSVTLRWWNHGDPDVQYYRIAAIPYDPRLGSANPTWQNATVPGICGNVSTVFRGLTTGERYYFMLEAVEVNHVGTRPALHRGIGRTEIVTVG